MVLKCLYSLPSLNPSREPCATKPHKRTAVPGYQHEYGSKCVVQQLVLGKLIHSVLILFSFMTGKHLVLK